jgi:hypothetical protein
VALSDDCGIGAAPYTFRVLFLAAAIGDKNQIPTPGAVGAGALQAAA